MSLLFQLEQRRPKPETQAEQLIQHPHTLTSFSTKPLYICNNIHSIPNLKVDPIHWTHSFDMQSLLLADGQHRASPWLRTGKEQAEMLLTNLMDATESYLVFCKIYVKRYLTQLDCSAPTVSLSQQELLQQLSTQRGHAPRQSYRAKDNSSIKAFDRQTVRQLHSQAFTASATKYFRSWGHVDNYSRLSSLFINGHGQNGPTGITNQLIANAKTNWHHQHQLPCNEDSADCALIRHTILFVANFGFLFGAASGQQRSIYRSVSSHWSNVLKQASPTHAETDDLLGWRVHKLEQPGQQES